MVAQDLPAGRRQWSERTLTVAVDVKSAYTQGTVPVAVWCDFVDEYLKIKPEEIVEIQDNILGNVLLIKMTSTSTFERVLGLLEAGIEWRLTGKTVYGWSCQRQLTKVKICNLTVHVSLDKVKGFMAAFGTIVQASLGYWKRWGGKVLDGTLTLLMDLNDGAEVPPMIDITSMGEQLLIFVEGSSKQQRSCFRCSRKGHIAPFCRYKPKVPDVSGGDRTWANIVAVDGIQGKGTGAKAPVSVPISVGSLTGVQVGNPTGALIGDGIKGAGGSTSSPPPPMVEVELPVTPSRYGKRKEVSETSPSQVEANEKRVREDDQGEEEDLDLHLSPSQEVESMEISSSLHPVSSNQVEGSSSTERRRIQHPGASDKVLKKMLDEKVDKVVGKTVTL